jgi:hypothetical protein
LKWTEKYAASFRRKQQSERSKLQEKTAKRREQASGENSKVKGASFRRKQQSEGSKLQEKTAK